MKVLHILEATSGGTRRHVLDLLPALQQRGAQCTLMYSPLRNPNFRHDALALQSAGVRTVQVAMGHRWSRRVDGEALRTIWSHLKRHRYDLVHCHSSNAGVLSRLANMAARPRVPLVYTPHYIAFGAGIPRPQRRAALYLEKFLASQTSHFIAVSKHERALIQRVLKIPNDNLSVIYNGVAPKQIALQAAANNSFTIGCFGRLTAQKNQSTLLRALPLVNKSVPNVCVKLIGSGEDEQLLRRLAHELQCNNRIDFCGEVDDVEREYSSCDLVAHPSRWEGCSYSLLEAMNMGRAIIASNAGGNPEVLGDAGVLLPRCNHVRLADEIITLARDNSRREDLGKKAYARVAEDFRLDAMVEQTLDVYDNVTESRATRN